MIVLTSRIFHGTSVSLAVSGKAHSSFLPAWREGGGGGGGEGGWAGEKVFTYLIWLEIRGGKESHFLPGMSPPGAPWTWLYKGMSQPSATVMPVITLNSHK